MPIKAKISGPRVARPQSLDLPNVLGFTSGVVRTADTFDLLDRLKQIPTLEADVERKAVGADVRLLKLHVQLLGQALVASLEASSAAAEARCEQARTDQLADRLAGKQSARRTTLTLTSVIIAGVTSIITGGLLTGDSLAAGIVAVTGGALGAGAGGLALLDGGGHEFQHRRNLLKDIWEGPEESAVFPHTVWQFLNRSRKGSEGRTLREDLIAGWRQEGRLGEPDSESESTRTALLFGEGGIYQVDDLRARTAMLEMLASVIDLMHEDLQWLAREIAAREALMDRRWPASLTGLDG